MCAQLTTKPNPPVAHPPTRIPSPHTFAHAQDNRCADCGVWWGHWQGDDSILREELKGNRWLGCRNCPLWWCSECKSLKEVNEHQGVCIPPPRAKKSRGK